MSIDPLRFYHLETYLFEDVRARFFEEHSIGAFDLFSIIIWKANRAKSTIAKRLLRRCRDLERAARELTSALYTAPSARERLRITMEDWGFLLPMASAILTVLWPEEFTVYDTRVCGELGDFEWLANRSEPSRVWNGYLGYRAAVKNAAPHQHELRDCDRYLWGRSAIRQLEHDIETGFAADATPQDADPTVNPPTPGA